MKLVGFKVDNFKVTNLDKSDIPERIGVGDVLRMEVDLLNFMDNFSSFVGSLFIEDTSLDSEAARAVGATVDTVTSSHDPVRSDDGTLKIENSELLIIKVLKINCNINNLKIIDLQHYFSVYL